MRVIYTRQLSFFDKLILWTFFISCLCEQWWLKAPSRCEVAFTRWTVATWIIPIRQNIRVFDTATCWFAWTTVEIEAVGGQELRLLKGQGFGFSLHTHVMRISEMGSVQYLSLEGNNVSSQHGSLISGSSRHTCLIDVDLMLWTAIVMIAFVVQFPYKSKRWPLCQWYT